jgi:hypothetical protein
VSRLEDRYRTVLRLLPAGYRAAWEEDMVATFLDGAVTGDAEQDRYLAEWGRPDIAEIASVAALALRLRLGGPDAPPRSFAWGQAARLAALVGLLYHAVLLPMAAAQQGWLAAELWLPASTRAAVAAGPPAGGWADMWFVGEMVVGLLWLGAYLALVAGRRRAGLVLAIVAVLPGTAAVLTDTLDMLLGRPSAPPFLATPWCLLLIDALVVATLAAFHRQAPPVPRRPWLIALAAGSGLAAILGVLVLVLLQPIGRPWLDWPGLLCLVWLAAAMLPRATRSVPAALAVAMLGWPVLGLRTASVLDSAAAGSVDAAILTLGLVEAAAVGVLALRLHRHSVSRLPPLNAPLPPTPSLRS